VQPNNNLLKISFWKLTLAVQDNYLKKKKKTAAIMTVMLINAGTPFV
jgi:hypothetical protein